MSRLMVLPRKNSSTVWACAGAATSAAAVLATNITAVVMPRAGGAPSNPQRSEWARRRDQRALVVTGLPACAGNDNAVLFIAGTGGVMVRLTSAGRCAGISL